ncbi:translation elongation factor EF-G [Clostridium beijerinckii]|nr:translation elongation factor EF-G [Clostridium beijerinckii]
MTVLNVNKDKNGKLSHICFIRGKTQIPAKRIIAGDIGAILSYSIQIQAIL